ncbi:hypothetical protein [Shewanella sp.]|uniref:hypothetical protein n=1 Tax=Shewanella sp. TaxID=50422 RepID=UPI00356170A8
MVSLERLFCLISPKSLDIAAVMGGFGVFSKDDAIGVVAMIQGKFPIGARVLEVRVNDDSDMKNALIAALSSRFVIENLKPKAANALALMVVAEVCNSRTCKACNGTGYRLPRRYDAYSGCPSCAGTGVRLSTTDNLAGTFSALVNVTVTQEQFSKVFYDLYMDAIDDLYRQVNDAERYGHQILNIIKAEHICGSQG